MLFLAEQFIVSMHHTEVWPGYHKTLVKDLAGKLGPVNLIPIHSCTAVGGKPEEAVSVTAIWYVLDQASHIIDAVLDSDALLKHFDSPAEALNYALGLIFSSFEALAKLENADQQDRLTALFAECGFDSAHGYGLTFQRQAESADLEASLEKYWKETLLKSGSVYRCAAQAGALAAGPVAEEQYKALGQYGYCVGVISQILDDCRDMHPDRGEERLPWFAAQAAHDLTHETSDHSLPAGERIDAQNLGVTISELLQDWKKRALVSLQSLAPSPAREALESIVSDLLGAELGE